MVKNYHIETKGDRLIFSTSSFKAERGSVLHKGIYNKEFTSVLVASAICMLTYMAIVNVSDEIGFIHYMIIITVFIIAFLFARLILFKKKYLEVVFDKSNNVVNINRPGFIRKSTERIPLNNIKSIDIGSKKFSPENIDGIRFVEKISAQHGSYIPGLEDEEEFITLSLRLSDGSEKTIYAGNAKEEPEIPLREIKQFLESQE